MDDPLPDGRAGLTPRSALAVRLGQRIGRPPRTSKKAVLDDNASRTAENAVVPPWFASVSRRKPQRVQAYPGAVTGAPVAACAGNSPQSARSSKTMFGSAFRALSHQPGSLLRSSLPTLLFTAFAKNWIVF